MALLLETTLGDLVIDLDLEGSPELCKNVLKLAKARYYTSNLIYNIQPNRFCQFGCPFGDGSGGACIYGYMDVDGSSANVLKSQQRFLRSEMGRPLSEEECRMKGRVVMTEMNGVPNTLGSQLLVTVAEGDDKALDGYNPSSIQKASAVDSKGRPVFRSLGVVSEDHSNILDQLASTYCDSDGRPYADIRIIRASVVDDPFDDPPGLNKLMEHREVVFDDDDSNVVAKSPDPERPPEERVPIRISADQLDPAIGEEDFAKIKEREEEQLKRQDKSRAVVLEMLGDLPSADITAPENVLFVCKLNPVTADEDLELIFSRFDENVKVEIIRDPETGNSLQYAFAEFTSKQQAAEAYLKMNNALVDDRRIKVDFSQSVAKTWNKYTQRARNASGGGKFSNIGMPRNPTQQHNRYGDNSERRPNNYSSRNNRDNSFKQPRHEASHHPHSSRRDGGEGRGRPMAGYSDDRHRPHHNNRAHNRKSNGFGRDREIREEEAELDQFGRKKRNWNSVDRKNNDEPRGRGHGNGAYSPREEGRGSPPAYRRHDQSRRSRSQERYHRHHDEVRDHHRNQRRHHERNHVDDGETQDSQRRQSRDRREERSPEPRRRHRRGSSRSSEGERSDNNGKGRRRGRYHRYEDDRRRKSWHGGGEGSEEDSGDSRQRRLRRSGSREDSREGKHHHSRHRRKEASSNKHSLRHDSDAGNDSDSKERRHRKRKDEKRDSRRHRHRRSDSRDRHDEKKRRRDERQRKSKHRDDKRGDKRGRRRSPSRSVS